MGKIVNLDQYILECDKIIEYSWLYDEQDKLEFIRKIEGIYGEEIQGFRRGLEFYERCFEHGEEIYLDDDIQRIRAKLINYKDNLEIEDKKNKQKVEIARLKQANINISANANNSNTINITIILNQAVESISQIPDNILTKEEKEELEDNLYQIDATVRHHKKEKAKEKIFNVSKFLADKGADALIAMLPYLGQMAGVL